MNTNGKTVKESKNYKPAHAAKPARATAKPAHAAPKKKADTRKIAQAIIFGPTIAILSVMLIYIAWWGIAKAFIALHAVVIESFVPWVGKCWPAIIAVWAIIALTSVVYYYFVVEQKKNTSSGSSVSVKTKSEPKFDPELDIALDELLEDVDENEFPLMGLDDTKPQFKAVTKVYGPKKEPEFISEG